MPSHGTLNSLLTIKSNAPIELSKIHNGEICINHYQNLQNLVYSNQCLYPIITEKEGLFLEESQAIDIRKICHGVVSRENLNHKK